MMRNIFFASFLFLLTFFARAQNGFKPALSPGKAVTLKNITDFENLVKHYRHYKQDSAIYYAHKGLGFARQSGDSSAVARMLLQMGMIDDNLGEFQGSQIKYAKALELFTIANNRKGIAAANIRIGVVALREGKYDTAIEYFLNALKSSESINDKFGVMEANYSISWAWLDQRNYSNALQYLEIAERYNNELPFSNISLNIYNHFGVIYRETRRYDIAKSYLTKGIRNSNEPQYQGLNITLINNLASVYAKEGQIEKAIALQEEALNRSRQIGNYLRELQTLLGLSKSYGKNNPEKAIFYIRQAVDLAKEKKVPKQEMRYLKIMTDLYKSQGNYKDALTAKEREHELADSFFYKTMVQNIESLKAEYELSKSNAKITKLNLQNKQRQLALKNTAIIRNVILAVTILLVIILCLLYNQYRIKQKNSKAIKFKNQSLERLLDEKEWLLKEVHHRVKNNLHTITSLLETQSAYLKDDAFTAVQTSQHRVHAMSLLHQKLYQLENATTLNMAVYLPELVHYLRDSYDAKREIPFNMQIEEIHLDISQAIPVALILNEAVTNSMKYAFPGNSKGEISIRLKKKPGQMICLVIADNGIGLSPGWEIKPSESLGMKLIKGLSEDLQATYSIKGENGTTVQLLFTENIITKEKLSAEHLN